jgi:phage-related protein
MLDKISHFCDSISKDKVMPKTEVIIFAEENGSSPLIEWLDGMGAKVQDKCIVRVERLAEMGHELRRPEADFLRDGIYELRWKSEGVQFRVLYFFYKGKAVISHGIKKESEVPPKEIEMAIRRRKMFEKDPDKHSYEGGVK